MNAKCNHFHDISTKKLSRKYTIFFILHARLNSIWFAIKWFVISKCIFENYELGSQIALTINF